MMRGRDLHRRGWQPGSAELPGTSKRPATSGPALARRPAQGPRWAVSVSIRRTWCHASRGRPHPSWPDVQDWLGSVVRWGCWRAASSAQRRAVPRGAYCPVFAPTADPAASPPPRHLAVASCRERRAGQPVPAGRLEWGFLKAGRRSPSVPVRASPADLAPSLMAGRCQLALRCWPPASPPLERWARKCSRAGSRARRESRRPGAAPAQPARVVHRLVRLARRCRIRWEAWCSRPV